SRREADHHRTSRSVRPSTHRPAFPGLAGDRVDEEVRATIGKIAANAGAIEFVVADLNSDDGWANAVTGADYVLHVASPVPTVDPKSDDELVRPARDGTLRVLKAARDAGVKRIVVTSSISAIIYGRGVREKPFTEADWTDETNRNDTSPYDRAKTIAERAAWAWHKAEGGGLELVTVNPGLVSAPFSGQIFRLRLRRSGSCWTVRSRPCPISASTWSTYAASQHCKCWR